MAVVWPTPDKHTGDTINESDWKVHVDNLNQLNTRGIATDSTDATQNTRLTSLEGVTTNATTGNTQLGSRLTTVESRTTNATTGNTQLGSRLTTVESRTTDSSTGNTQLGSRVSTLETNQGTRGTNGTIYAEIADLKANSGGSAGPAVFFNGYITAESIPITAGAGNNLGGGVNLDFTASGLSYQQQGGFSLSAHEIRAPSTGIYLIQVQAVLSSVTGGTGTPSAGIYILKASTAGNTGSVACKEIKYTGVTNFIMEQVVGVVVITNTSTEYIAYRLYSGVTSARSAYGMGFANPYGGTHINITKLGNLS